MSLLRKTAKFVWLGKWKLAPRTAQGLFSFDKTIHFNIKLFSFSSSFLILSYLFVKTFYWRTDFDLNSATSERKRKRRNKLMNRFQRRRERKNRFETNKIGTILICFRSELISANKVLCKSQKRPIDFFSRTLDSSKNPLGDRFDVRMERSMFSVRIPRWMWW